MNKKLSKKGFTQHLFVWGSNKNLASNNKGAGFTLIELLIVIGIIAILAAIIFVAVDPARRLAEARNAERWSSVNAVLNGVLQYVVDEQGDFPATATALDAVPGTVQMIGNNTGGAIDCADLGAMCSGVNFPVSDCFVTGLDTDLVDLYLASIPIDPGTTDSPSADNTLYYINRSANGRITVGACAEEQAGDSTPDISVSR